MPLQKNIRVLDSLRGLLALVVALHHAAVPFWGAESGLVKNSYLFVDFFFVLSGFVLLHGYAGRINTARDFGHFLALRFFRLWPLHIVTLSVMALCWWMLPKWGFAPMTGQEDASVASFTAMATLSHAMGTVPSYPFNWPSWSIAAEFVVYSVFALLCVASLNNKALRILGGFLFCMLGIVGTLDRGPEFGPAYLLNITQWGVFRAFTGFFLGMLLRDLLLSLPLDSLRRWPSLVECAVLGVTVVALCFLNTGSQWVWAILPLFTLVIAVLAFEAGRVSRALCHPVLLALGRWSFSIYLVHLGVAKLISEFVFPHVWGWAEALYLPFLTMPVVASLCAIVYLGMVVGLAAFTYKAIEMPAMSWARRYFSLSPRQKKVCVQADMVYRHA